MEEYPEEFFPERHPKSNGVFLHPVRTDINFAGNLAFVLGQIKADDIGVGIMTQVFLVDLQQVRVGTENIVKLLQGNAFFFKKPFNKTAQGYAAGEFEILFQEMKVNGWLSL